MLDLGEKILALLQMAFGFWNWEVDNVFKILKQSPVEFKNGTPWQVVEKMNPTFVAIGSSLVTLFFVIGFCSECVDIREEMRVEVILRMLIRIGLAEWLVINNIEIAKILFKSVNALVELLKVKDLKDLTIPSSQASVIKNLGFAESIVFLLLAVIVVLIVIICGFFMLYTVYFRFLRIMVIIPLGTLAFSTTAGNRMVAHTAVTYGKYFLSVILEAVAMALAIIVCNSFLSAGLPSFTGNFTAWAKTLLYLCEMTFSVALTAGAVRGSQQLVSRALGL